MVVRQIKDEDQMWCKHCGQHVNHLEKTFSFFWSHAMVWQAMGHPTQCVATYAYLLSNQDNFGVLHVALRPFVVRQKTTNNDEQRRTTTNHILIPNHEPEVIPDPRTEPLPPLCWSRQAPAWTRRVHLDAPGQRHRQQPVSGTADPRSSQTGQVIRGLR